MNPIQDLLNKRYIFAVVGASENPEKYGFKVLKDLHDAGYSVIPVNPKGGYILGLPVEKSLKEANFRIDVVVFVTQPEISLALLSFVKELPVKGVWFQPGSESRESIEYCKKNNIPYVVNMCVMIQRKK